MDVYDYSVSLILSYEVHLPIPREKGFLFIYSLYCYFYCEVAYLHHLFLPSLGLTFGT